MPPTNPAELREKIAQIIGVAMNTSACPPSSDNGVAWVRQRKFEAADAILSLLATDANRPEAGGELAELSAKAELPNSAPWEGGKCRVPMWTAGAPDGFCGEAANGPQLPRRVLGRDPPYCFGPCCPKHGGPKDGEPILFIDGSAPDGRPMWCAVMPGFVNLQESLASFDVDPLAAIAGLRAARAGRPSEGHHHAD